LNRDLLKESSSILHIAPELCLVNKFKHVVKSENYLLADNDVQLYKEAFNLDCMKIDLTKKLPFEANIFDLILHNHVLEHLVGTYKDHIDNMIHVLKPGGKIVFTIPFFKKIKNTIENGEYLSSDEERKLAFGQEDHYKIFGKDFLYYLNTLTTASVETVLLENFSSMDTVFIVSKHINGVQG
jgi:SAM-dependent methyltransferase